MHKATLAAALVLGVYGAAAMAQQPPLNSDQDKTLYALGIAIGRNVKDFSLTSKELAIVQEGFRDAALGNKSQVDLQAYGPKIQALAQERTEAAAATEKKKSSEFLAKMAKEKGAVRTDSGLVYVPVDKGTGASPTADDTVRVTYKGMLPDGTVFDSSEAHGGKPITISLTSVIPCWTEGVQKMHVGGKAKLGCPSDLAYGDRGQGPIPGGAALVFDVSLLGIEKGTENGAGAKPEAGGANR